MAIMETIKAWPAQVAGWAGRLGRNMAEAISRDSSKPLWPPVEDAARRNRYERNQKVFDGEHREVFVGYEVVNNQKQPVPGAEFQFLHDPTRPYIPWNLSRRLSKLLASRGFGEGFAIQGPEDAAATVELLNSHVYQQGDLAGTALRGALQLSPKGDLFLKCYYDADEMRLRVVSVDPARCYLEPHPLDASRTVAINIDQLAQVADDRAYLWRERHELREGAGYVVNKLYRMEKDGKGWHFDESDAVPLDTIPETAYLLGKEDMPTGVNDLLVVHITNRAASDGSAWGEADYSRDLLELQGELNNRLTQRADVQDKFVHPMLAVPHLEDMAQGNGIISLVLSKIIEVPEGGTPPAYLTWDAQLSSVEASIKETVQAYATTAGVDTVSLLPRESGAPVAARALRIEQMNTQGEAVDKQKAMEPGLRRVLSICSQLMVQEHVKLGAEHSKLRALTPEEITIKTGDGLPSMMMEDIEEESERLLSGTRSIVDSLMRLDGLSKEVAVDTFNRIATEKRAMMAGLTLPGGTAAPETVATTAGRLNLPSVTQPTAE